MPTIDTNWPTLRAIHCQMAVECSDQGDGAEGGGAESDWMKICTPVPLGN